MSKQSTHTAAATSVTDPQSLLTPDPAPAPAPPPAEALTIAPEPATDVAPDPALDANGYDAAAYDWVPVLRKPRADGWNAQRQQAFIDELADTGCVSVAADRVGMSTSSAYRLRRAADGRAFAAAWDAAMHEAARALVDAAFDRALNGSDEPVFNRDGRRIGRRMRRSDAMLMFLLRKHFPERYGDLHRDRPAGLALPGSPPPVARTLSALAPVPPADPAALLAPDDLLDALELADAADGQLPRWQRQDGRDRPDPMVSPLGAAFEEKLAAAKAKAYVPPLRYADEDDGGGYDSV